MARSNAAGLCACSIQSARIRPCHMKPPEMTRIDCVPSFRHGNPFANALAAMLLLCSTAVLGNNLLLDNFNGAGNPNPSDINYNLAARQAGSSLGTVTWTSNGNPTQLGHAVMPDGLRVASGWASPDHSFSGIECAGGLVIEFDINPQSGTSNPAWLAINLGMTEANRWTSINHATSHLSLTFFDTGYTEIYDGANRPTWFYNGVPAGSLTHVRLELTDATDGNPLDGVGQTTIAVYVANSSTPAGTYTKTGGGLAGGYIAFQAWSTDIGLLDNLRIAGLIPTQPPSVEIATYAGIAVTGAVGYTYGIEATTTPENAASWIGVGNVLLTTPTQIWYDSRSTVQQPKRFYRAVAGAVTVPPVGNPSPP